jgi:hypothetical protein
MKVFPYINLKCRKCGALFSYKRYIMPQPEEFNSASFPILPSDNDMHICPKIENREEEMPVVEFISYSVKPLYRVSNEE